MTDTLSDPGGRPVGDCLRACRCAFCEIASGQVHSRKIDASDVFSLGHHPRCYPNKATDRYIITNNRGAEFIGLTSDERVGNDWLRGNCGLGVTPANGMLYALAASDGRQMWAFTAGERIDSPPTQYENRVLFGSADGWVYCLRISDGTLAWRSCAAPQHRLVGVFGQIESAWPVHGSVLVVDGIAYVTAGRS